MAASCGVNIPIDDLVAEIIKRLSLDQYVKVQDGEARNLTLKDGVILDEDTIAAFCNYLHDCIIDAIDEYLGCDCEAEKVQLGIDLIKDWFTQQDRCGNLHHTTRKEFEDWLKLKGGGIESGAFTLAEDPEKYELLIKNKDGTETKIDAAPLLPLGIKQPTLKAGKYLVFPKFGGEEYEVDMSGLIPPNSPYLVKAAYRFDDGGTPDDDSDDKHFQDYTRSDNVVIPLEVTDMVNRMVEVVFERVMRIGYTINTQTDDYTTKPADFDGRTIIRAAKDGHQNITLTKPPSERFVGKTVMITKAAGALGTFLNLIPDSGVTIAPDDATPLRRIGNAVTLLYIGDGLYEVFGELP